LTKIGQNTIISLEYVQFWPKIYSNFDPLLKKYHKPTNTIFRIYNEEDHKRGKNHCAICDESFHSIDYLMSHNAKFHITELNFACDQCDYKVIKLSQKFSPKLSSKLSPKVVPKVVQQVFPKVVAKIVAKIVPKVVPLLSP
jgi:hypothetical protein